RPCDANGNFLEDPHAPPPPRNDPPDFEPFADRPSFEYAELIFEKMLTSEGDIDHLLKIWKAKRILDGHDPETDPGFDSHSDLFDTIDSIPYGDTAWSAFSIQYTGPVGPDAPSWKRERYVVYLRDSLHAVENMASSADFQGSWHTRPYRQWNEQGTRVYSDVLSGHWAWKQADSIAADPATHGAMFTPVCLAADKTTASVATGHQEFHPAYLMAGNVTNDMRRAHRDAVLPIAFLPIPTAETEHDDTDEFRLFKKQIYHAALKQIFEPLRPGMTTPHIMRCPDGHYRRAIFGIGPVIADYPEQVFMSGIVQGWCPKCQALPDDLDHIGVPRFCEHTRLLRDTYDPGTLWNVFGVPFTEHFPRADIHKYGPPGGPGHATRYIRVDLIT
ncbi:uncharacterized protein TRAVEDRAFT_137240, partial [Trametes versicolor FP-101664 SS1]